MQTFMLTLLTCSLWGLVVQFMAGYFFLHSWLNLWGELLKFADREFYSVSSLCVLWEFPKTPCCLQDWWTCTSFSAFYRKWNLLVHDWIKAYIYQDMKDVSCITVCSTPQISRVQLFRRRWYNRIASLPTIIISAVFHEYVLWAPVRFVLPLLLIMFGLFGGKVTVSWFASADQLPLQHRHPLLCAAKHGITLLELLPAHRAAAWSQCHGVCVCH